MAANDNNTAPKPVEQRRKPAKCPACGSSKVLRLVVGYPFDGPPLAPDERFSGGCCPGPEQPAWACDACKHSWGRWK